MAMRNVQSSTSLQPGLLRGYGKSDAARTEAEATESRPAAAAERGASQADTVQLSAKARQMERLRTELELARQHYADAPDNREEVVERVRTRLEAGEYGSPAARQEVATRLGAVMRKLEELIG